MTTLVISRSLISHWVPCWRYPISRLVFIVVYSHFKWVLWSITIFQCVAIIWINCSSMIINIKFVAHHGIVITIFIRLEKWIMLIPTKSRCSRLNRSLLAFWKVHRWFRFGRLLFLWERLIRMKAFEVFLAKIWIATCVLFLQFCIITLLRLSWYERVTLVLTVLHLLTHRSINLVWFLVVFDNVRWRYNSLDFRVTLMICESFRLHSPHSIIIIFVCLIFLFHVGFKVLLFETLIVIRDWIRYSEWDIMVAVFWSPGSHCKEIILCLHRVGLLLVHFGYSFLVSNLKSRIDMGAWKVSFLGMIVIVKLRVLFSSLLRTLLQIIYRQDIARLNWSLPDR